MLQQAGPSGIWGEQKPAGTRLKKNHRIKCSNPVVRSKEKLSDRVLSFRGCSSIHRVSIMDCCKAGFFCRGSTIKLKCYNCGGELQEWQPSDDPFYEHAKWFPECEYIQKCIGVDYVTEVVKKHPCMSRPTIHNPIPLPLIRSSMLQSDTNNTTESSSSVDQRVEEAMTSEIVMPAVTLGFDPTLVRALVRKKFERENVGYLTVLALVEDLQEALASEEDNGEDIIDSEATMPSFSRPHMTSVLPTSPTPVPNSKPVSFVLDFCFFKIAFIPRFC